MYRLTSKITTNPINQSGLIAGAIGGESVVLAVLVNTLMVRAFAQGTLPPTSPEITAWTIVYPFLIIVTFEGWGVFAAWLSISAMKNVNDAFISGFIAGIVIGILLEVMWVAQLVSLVAHQLSSYAGAIPAYSNTFFIILVLVVFVLLGGVLSGFGSYVFYLFKSAQQYPPHA